VETEKRGGFTKKLSSLSRENRGGRRGWPAGRRRLPPATPAGDSGHSGGWGEGQSEEDEDGNRFLSSSWAMVAHGERSTTAGGRRRCSCRGRA
jgi:hypothetical protein